MDAKFSSRLPQSMLPTHTSGDGAEHLINTQTPQMKKEMEEDIKLMMQDRKKGTRRSRSYFLVRCVFGITEIEDFEILSS